MHNNNLWAPWRFEYIKSLDEFSHQNEEKDCFLCGYWSMPQRDKDNLVLWRTELSLVLLNRFPYTGGHLLIAPAAHVASMDELSEPALLEIMTLARDARKVLSQILRPHGFNFGANIGRCAGAGLPGHFHAHLVPRWLGDTNFMAITGKVRVISHALEDLYRQLQQASVKLDLPSRK